MLNLLLLLFLKADNSQYLSYSKLSNQWKLSDELDGGSAQLYAPLCIGHSNHDQYGHPVPCHATTEGRPSLPLLLISLTNHWFYMNSGRDSNIWISLHFSNTEEAYQPGYSRSNERP
jgi:hypothetical protein